MVLLAAGAVFLFPVRPEKVQLPNPNGYDDFRKAATLIATPPDDLTTVSDDEFRRFVEANAEALRLVRAGLAKDCKVPVTYTYAVSEERLNELSGLKSIAQALVAIGRWHERQQQTNEAARRYVEAIRYGHHSLREGLLTDILMTIAIERIASRPLRKSAPTLDAALCREIISALQQIDDSVEPIDRVFERDNEIIQTEHRFAYYWYRLVSAISGRTALSGLTANAHAKARQHYDASRRQRYELIAELAARAYELEHGRPPKGFDDLCPAYIKNIPPEFRTATNAIYNFPSQ
ncbi:MAG: hypothetical protein L0Y58_19760 [Verrucomicrobia subdivision 3 bacterium]|nr:hypothetical protein [Limisphaerales bacterium]